MKINSIRVKIVSLIIFVLLLIVTASLSFSLYIQRDNLISATQRTLFTNTEILNRTIRNIMVSGEAPIAVNTMKSLAEIEEFQEIRIYRVDGSNAFNDYATLNFVNNYQKKIVFPKTPRLERNIFDNPNFQKVLETSSPLEFSDLEKNQRIEYFYPILNNDVRCRACHGDPSTGEADYIRGVAHFTIPVDRTLNQINKATLILTLVFAGIGILFTILLVFFMRRLIISPLNRIGGAVTALGNGDLDARVQIKNRDELGDLAAKINDMIKGLKERFHLSKYVSRSTENLIVSGGGRAEDGVTQKRIVVLFSDVRGFTSFTESRPPETVINVLNEILQAQTEIVEKCGGDIDKFVGDELMAVFTDEYTAVRCAVDLVKAVYAINKKQGNGLYIGVGINAGEVIAGNIGSTNRLEYAVIGDPINLASRLCSLARKNMILISEAINEKVKDRVETSLIANQKIKGKAEAVNFYAVKAIKVVSP
ncbi:MAG: HAMP domain-containing protein [Spirochaetales bacterium]|nr:HAMP domain-containing protein [Spirochaetales bacterium]